VKGRRQVSFLPTTASTEERQYYVSNIKHLKYHQCLGGTGSSASEDWWMTPTMIFTGIGIKNDVVVFDAIQNLDEKFGAGGDKVQNYSILDDGAGIDTLTLKLTESQYAAFEAEVAEKLGAIKAGGIDFSDIASICKGWECFKFDVCKS
jgi:hypothetical protein